jgi:hypothetical protein
MYSVQHQTILLEEVLPLNKNSTADKDDLIYDFLLPCHESNNTLASSFPLNLLMNLLMSRYEQ